MASTNGNKTGDEGIGSDEDKAILECIPLACVLCEKSYASPIVAQCGHQSCETCGLQRH